MQETFLYLDASFNLKQPTHCPKALAAEANPSVIFWRSLVIAKAALVTGTDYFTQVNFSHTNNPFAHSLTNTDSIIAKQKKNI